MSGYANQNVKQDSMTAHPSKYPQGYFNDKACKECQKLFSPIAPSHKFCSQECSDLGYSRRYLKNAYGITLEEYNAMFVAQDHKCAICFDKGFKICHNAKSLLAVDHCHKTGKVRGLLCHNCNRALGLFQDSIENVNSALDYLKNEGFY